MDDLISRQAAIDAVNAWLLLRSLNRTMSNATSLQDVLRQLPSAKPETEERTAETVQNVSDSDLIYRKAAIDELDKEYRCTDQSDDWDGLKTAMLIIENLPTAQPENTQLSIEDATFDCISRKAAIDAFRQELVFDYEEQCTTFTGIKKILEALPSAQTEQRWISVTERLPEDYTDVLAWFEYYRYGDYNRLYQMHGIGSYSTEYDSWMINHETGWHKLRVIAWMPLPEPYKERREE